MHGLTQRRVCRLLFAILALAPCCGALGLACWRNSTWDDAPFKSVLRETLGVAAEWDRLTYAAPGEMRCENLRLYDAQSAALLAEIDEVLVVDRGDNRVLSPGVVRVHVSQMSRLTELIQTLVGSETSFQGTIQPCEWELVDAQRRLLAKATILRADSWESDGRRNASVTFRTDQVSRDAEIKLNLQGDASKNTLRVLLDTHGHPLGLATASVLWPELHALGSRAYFSGTLDSMRNAQGWHAQVRGNVERIDLDTLVNGHTTQQLTGAGALRIDEARFVNGRLVAANGMFGATDGEIGLGLLSDASSWFRFESKLIKQELKESERRETAPYSELRVAFRVNESRCELTGTCDPGHALILDEDGAPLLRAATKPHRPHVATAIQMFYTTAAPKVAASQESWWLTGWLSLPPATELPPYGSTEQPRQAAANPNPIRKATAH